MSSRGLRGLCTGFVQQSSDGEEEVQSSPTPTDHASTPRAVDSTLASKQTADSSTQTDNFLEQATEQSSTQTAPTPEQPPSVPPALQTPSAALTPQIPIAVPARARIPLSRPQSPEPCKPCRSSCFPATLVFVCAFVFVMALAIARDSSGRNLITEGSSTQPT